MERIYPKSTLGGKRESLESEEKEKERNIFRKR